jgi:CRISPR-associated protein Cas2
MGNGAFAGTTSRTTFGGRLGFVSAIHLKVVEILIAFHFSPSISGRTNMFVLVTYDVATSSKGGQKRLRRVAKACMNYGQRVQNSVFECQVDPAQFTALKGRLHDLIRPSEDSLRFYFLGSNWRHRVEHFGANRWRQTQPDRRMK